MALGDESHDSMHKINGLLRLELLLVTWYPDIFIASALVASTVLNVSLVD